MTASLDPMRKKTAVDTFRLAMRNTANCVAIVATLGTAGRAGITVSSMVSVTADPPMLLVCVNRSSPAHDIIRANSRFSVNVLGVQQSSLADSFAGRGDRPFQFDERAWTFDPLPMLDDCAASYDCDLHDSIAAGTHSILLGRVRDSAVGIAEPLCYSGRKYVRVTSLESSSTNSVLERIQRQSRLACIQDNRGYYL